MRRNDKSSQAPPPPTVFVVDDDADVRDALENLFRSVGHGVAVFASVAELLQSAKPDMREASGCIVLDVRLPGVSGLDFQNQLARANTDIPIIFMTGYGDVPMSVRAMKAGAVDFLTKPFRDQDMLDAVAAAIERDRARRERVQAAASVRDSFSGLSPREREVMVPVTRCLMNKQVAGALGLSELTVKLYRGQVMRKMAARSLADLVRMAELLELHAKRP